jgi:nucleoside-diphosphate-sugar epimerase
MTVSVRPGKPNGAASGFFSGMIREPLAGLPAACPVPDATPVAIASPARTIEGIIRAAEASDVQWGPRTALNLPSLATTVGEMAAALERVAGKAATALLDRTPDPTIQRIVKTWPGHIETVRARALGLTSDENFEAVIREYVRENPDAVKLPGVA